MPTARSRSSGAKRASAAIWAGRVFLLAAKCKVKRTDSAQPRLPAANPAHVYMNKIRFRVVSHATTGKSLRSIAQSRRCNPGYTDIDSLGLHVQTMQGNAITILAQKFITPWRAISANNVDL